MTRKQKKMVVRIAASVLLLVGAVLVPYEGVWRFALFLPGEPHKPSCRTPRCDKLRKAVVKIEML